MSQNIAFVTNYNAEKCHGCTGKKEQCSRDPNKDCKGAPKSLCKMHFNKWNNDKEAFTFVELKVDSSASTSATTKATKGKNSPKKSAKAPAKKPEEDEVEEEPEEQEEVDTNEAEEQPKAVAVNPKGAEYCRGKKKNSQEFCTLKAKYSGYCHHHRQDGGGKTSGKAKTPATSELGTCTGESKSTNKPCRRNATGIHPETGKAVCPSHGAPKKTAASKAKKTSSAPSGPLSGIAVLPLSVGIAKFFRDHIEEDCTDCTEEGLCPDFVAANWLLKFFELNSNAIPSAQDLLNHFSAADLLEDGEPSFHETHGSTVFLFLEGMVGRENVMGLVHKLQHFANISGDRSAEVNALWELVREEFGITVTPQNSNTKEPKQSVRSSQLSNTKRQNVSNLVRRAEAEAAAEDEEEEPQEKDEPIEDEPEEDNEDDEEFEVEVDPAINMDVVE